MWYKINNEMINLDRIQVIYIEPECLGYIITFLINYETTEGISASFATQKERDIEYDKLQNMLLNPLISYPDIELCPPYKNYF